MDNEHDQKTMMDVGEDSGIASNDSDSRRESLASNASMRSTATSNNDSAIGSSGHSSAGYPNSVSSIRRPSVTSVQSDDSTTTLRSDVTSERNRTSTTSVADHQQGSGHATGTYSKSGYTKGSTHVPTTNTQPTTGIIQIQVVDYASKTHIVRVRPTDKVKDLKVKVQEKLKIAPSQQRLQFQGKMLDDKSTSSLKSQGLHDMCTVYLQGRLQGGALFSTA